LLWYHNMLPVNIQSLYQPPAIANTAPRDIAIRPIYTGEGNRKNTGDEIALSDDGKQFAKMLTEQEKNRQNTAASTPAKPYVDPEQLQQSRRAEQVRGQVLGYLLGIGMAMMDAIPQTEKIIARMGYQQGKREQNPNSQNELNGGRERPKSNVVKADGAMSASSVNILV